MGWKEFKESLGRIMLNKIFGILHEMAQATRAGLSDSDFVFPEERKFPIQSKKQAKIALTFATWPQNKKYRAKVVSAVLKRYPDLKGYGAATESFNESDEWDKKKYKKFNEFTKKEKIEILKKNPPDPDNPLKSMKDFEAQIDFMDEDKGGGPVIEIKTLKIKESSMFQNSKIRSLQEDFNAFGLTEARDNPDDWKKNFIVLGGKVTLAVEVIAAEANGWRTDVGFSKDGMVIESPKQILKSDWSKTFEEAEKKAKSFARSYGISWNPRPYGKQ